MFGNILNQKWIEAHFFKQFKDGLKLTALDFPIIRNTFLNLPHKLDQRRLAHQNLVPFAGALFFFDLVGALFDDLLLERIDVGVLVYVKLIDGTRLWKFTDLVLDLLDENHALYDGFLGAHFRENANLLLELIYCKNLS